VGHAGEDLPSVRAGEPFVIFGFRNTPFDFSDVAFPQDLRTCRRCHEDSEHPAPQAARWRTNPSSRACGGACHDVPNALATTKQSGPTPTGDDLATFVETPLDDLNVTPAGAACAGCHDWPTP
jgi:OmcA/MtrC family decaheme c-type cytochrome